MIPACHVFFLACLYSSRERNVPCCMTKYVYMSKSQIFPSLLSPSLAESVTQGSRTERVRRRNLSSRDHCWGNVRGGRDKIQSTIVTIRSIQHSQFIAHHRFNAQRFHFKPSNGKELSEAQARERRMQAGGFRSRGVKGCCHCASASA